MENEEKNKGGRPPYEPTDQIRAVVSVMYAGGINKESIADAIGITTETMNKYYHAELASSKCKLDAEVIAALIKKIRAGDTASILFYLKTRCGWKETIRNENVDIPSHEEELNRLNE